MIQISGINGKDIGRQYVFFTARRLEGFSCNHFHWIPTAREIGAPSYFLRDTDNGFYLKNNRPALRLIKAVMKTFGGETWFIGSSMGAYGAIALGMHCKPQKIVAFCPAPPPDDNLHLRLKTAQGLPPIDIHVGQNSKWKLTNQYNDVENAMLFSESARIIRHDSDMHNIAGYLRERGELLGVLR